MSEVTLDLWADENEPIPEYFAHVWSVRLPDKVRSQYRSMGQPFIYVEVEQYGMATVQDHSAWFGKRFEHMSWDERKEVYDWLSEWELCCWRRIGPEDSEFFATKKLDPDFGVDY